MLTNVLPLPAKTMEHAIITMDLITVTVQRAGKENIVMEVYTKYRSLLSYVFSNTFFACFFNGLK